MKQLCKRKKFRLAETAAFDARRGYTRCTPPGMDIRIPPPSHVPWLRGTTVSADFWRDREGELVVRFTCTEGYTFSFQTQLVTGKTILEEDMEEFTDYISQVLWEWVIEGVDEIPESCHER